MISHKIFKHITWEYDKSNKQSVVLFAVDTSNDKLSFANKNDIIIKIKGSGINAISFPAENVEFDDRIIGSKLTWIRCCIHGIQKKFTTCKCYIYVSDLKICEKNISFGYKLRSRFKEKLELGTSKAINSFILKKFSPKKKIIISLHLWHLDVAKEILHVFDKTSKFCELRLAIPDNLDSNIADQLTEYIEKEFEFQKIIKLTVPSVGRDIGGLIASLIYSIKDGNYSSYPHLFIHTKNTPHLHPIIVNKWRKSLVNEISKDAKLVIAYFLFKLANACIIYSNSNDRVENGEDNIPQRKKSYSLSKKLSLELFNQSHNKLRFCAGTMMWVMPARVEKVWSIEKLQAVLSKLEPSPTMQEPSHAHAFERLFPDIVRRSGLKVFRI